MKNGILLNKFKKQIGGDFMKYDPTMINDEGTGKNYEGKCQECDKEKIIIYDYATQKWFCKRCYKENG